MSRNKRLLVKGLLLLVVGLTASQYARWAFQNRIRAEWIVYGEEIRPYVYRALVPILARGLMFLGLSPEQALTIVVIASAFGLLYGIKYLFASFRK